MNHPFICHACHAIVRSTWDQFEERLEFRRKADDGRYRVVLVARLCRTCTDERVAELRPAGPPVEQGTLL